MGDLDRVDGAPGDPALQPVADGLDLGKFGHAVRTRRVGASPAGRAAIARQAVSAAACSASFLLRPVLGGNVSPATVAAAVKVFS